MSESSGTGATAFMQVGDERVARRIAAAVHDLVDWPAGVKQVGAGSHRTVYLDRAAGVVYKVGQDAANRQEVHTLTALRAEGASYTPPATLHNVALRSCIFGGVEEWTCTVVAMPYLPHDDSLPGPAPLLPGAADLNPVGNVHANNGQWWLIDAGGL